jgi:hypothetical protein
VTVEKYTSFEISGTVFSRISASSTAGGTGVSSLWFKQWSASAVMLLKCAFYCCSVEGKFCSVSSMSAVHLVVADCEFSNSKKAEFTWFMPVRFEGKNVFLARGFSIQGIPWFQWFPRPIAYRPSIADIRTTAKEVHEAIMALMCLTFLPFWFSLIVLVAVKVFRGRKALQNLKINE